MKASKLVPSSIPGPKDIQHTVLPNGITILTRSNFNTASVVISGYVGAGSQLDPVKKMGLAHFTALGLMRGTQNNDFQTIFNRLESAGASLGFGAGVHNTSFGGRALAEDLYLLISTLADCLLNPIFPEDHMLRLKAQLLTGLAIRAQDTADMASLTFDKLLFPNHPYGRPEDGYPQTIKHLERTDLVKFHRDHYTPENMVIVIAGAMEHDRICEIIESLLGRWQKNSPSVVPAVKNVNHPQKTIRQHLHIPGKSQSDLVMGTLGPKRGAPEYLTASLGNNILGQFGMMGRIGDAVRERSGLAYYAATSLNAWIHSGSWEVSAGVNPENVEKTIDLVIEELKRFTREPVSRAELTDSQSNYIGRMPLSLESNSGVANSILNLERFNLGLDYLQRYPDLIRAVTAENILQTAQQYIDPERLIIVSAGSKPKLKKRQND